MIVLDGKKISNQIKEEITVEVTQMRERNEKVPHLAAVLVGNDGASLTYVGSKVRSCKKIGFESTLIHLPEDTSEEELLRKVHQLNADEAIDGYIVQLPLPKHINEQKILMAVDPDKDVDGFHPFSVGCLATGNPTFRSCTPYGVMKMLESIDYDLNGKEVVVVGRSNIVGKPVALMCLAENATVTICHSRTADLPAHVGRADVVIAAVGRPEMIRGEWIKEGAVVIDVGINRVGDKKLVGDVEFDAAAARAGYITPVPGGVGPMTITMLLFNTIHSATQRAQNL